MRGGVVFGLLVGCYSPTPHAGAPCPDGVCPTGLVCSPATMTCEISATPKADAAVDAEPDAFVPVDANVSLFAYRRRITIVNNSSTTMPTGFSIRVPLGNLATLVSQGKVNADFSDLRVIGDTLGERDRIVDPPSGPAPPALTFSLASSIAAGATSSEYALYYGRPTAPAAPANGNNVFPLFDEFNAGLSSVWLQNDAPSVSGGKVTLRANRLDALATNAATDNVPLVCSLEMITTISDPNSDPTVQPTGTLYYWFGFQRTGDFQAIDPWSVWIARGKGQLHAEQKSPNGCDPTSCDGPYATQDTTPHYYVVERDTGATRFYRDGTLSYTATVTNTDMSPMLRNFTAASTVTIDYVRARARVSPDPTVTVGNEQAL
ncbi:MAG TPA: hypothetical protein VMZ53_25030 [Kofleriaceae bacterium]|nr:hypothetical protein [Kofleriaceae bacterium]